MKKIKETLVSIFTIIILLVVGFLGGYWYSSHKAEEKAEVMDTGSTDITLPGEVTKRTVTIREIKSKLVKIGELSTYADEYTVTLGHEYSRYITDNFQIPGTVNSIVMECSGIVKVGYDLDDIGVEIADDTKTIYISLPEASVNDNYVIWDTVQCSEENNFLNPISFEQYQELLTEIEKEGLSDAEKHGIYRAAEDNLKEIIVNYLSGFDEYEVKFL